MLKSVKDLVLRVWSRRDLDMSNSPITPTPPARFFIPRVNAVRFDVWKESKLRGAAKPSLTKAQLDFCKTAAERLTEKLTYGGSWTLIDKEFDALATDKSVIQEALLKTHTAQLANNESKNRYVNVLPYDENRVKLETCEGEKVGNDYINASYVMDPMHENLPVYIATQGPLKSTTKDFWLMIFQQRCPVIVMLTRLVDGSQDKCAHYFPTRLNESHQHGSLRVTNKYIDVLGHESIVQRFFEIQNTNNPEDPPHTVMHLEYCDWPDFGVPTSTAPVRELVRILQFLCANAGPFVVHCSAGIGRTGTFCTINHSIRRILDGDMTALDVGRTVLQFRSQRSGMVQTRDQFCFCYEAIYDELEDLIRLHGQ